MDPLPLLATKLSSPILLLTPTEQEKLKGLMRQASAYDDLVGIIGRLAMDAMQTSVYASNDERAFRAGSAAALLQLREALAQAKTKVYERP